LRDFPKVQVAQALDGRYVVIAGPEPVSSDEEFRRSFADNHEVPKDFALTRGEDYIARAWQNVDPTLAAAEMSEGKSVVVSAGGLTASLRIDKIRKKKDEENVLVLEGRDNGKPVFTKRSEPLYSPQPHSKVSWVKLEGVTPQAVVSYYTGGAHCCMKSHIATRSAAGKWTLVDLRGLDGDFGPAFEDLDGDGDREILSGDNSFLYAFDSYAASSMPAKIEKLIGGKLVDVTRRPAYQRYHRQYLAWLEDGASEDNWQSNGFHAGWVAQKTLLGEGAEAWARVEKSYDRASDLGTEVCTVNKPIEACPKSRKRKVAFPVALRRFLDDNGYREAR
jgi:hypothetical protein